MAKHLKERLDVLLVELGFAPTRHKAQAMIIAGCVLINNIPVDKAGALVPINSDIRLRGLPMRFVSRGGEKIDPAFLHFNIDLTDVIAIDVGASTGGFTDCMLQRGAKTVYAVDVGHHQLDSRLRQDKRVIVMEQTHARDLLPEMFNPKPSFAVMDVSFISVRKVLSYVCAVLDHSAAFSLLILVKPQFELEPQYVSKGGVIKEEAHQMLAVGLVKESLEKQLGLSVYGEFKSPVKGVRKGNQEYFVFAGLNAQQ